MTQTPVTTPEPTATPARDIRHHYDTGNDFFRLWLDEQLNYSCALFRPGDTLEAAQRRKVNYHIERAEAASKRNVLDVGCGWGAVLRSLATEHGVERAVGLTLSDEQAKWINSWNLPGVEARVESWADHQPETRYDSILCIGSFEHFIRSGHSAAEKIESYRAFFDRAHELIQPGRLMSLQTIAYGTMRPGQLSQFITSSIFPGGELPRFAEVVEAADRRFEILSVSNDRPDYALTCREWARRLAARREEGVALVGEERVADFDRYLRMSAAGFEKGALVLLRFLFRAIEH